MEQIDILDEEGSKTGKTDTIESLHKNGKWHKVVGIIIYDQDKNILMQQRALKEKSDPGKWDIAAAGHIGSGEKEVEGIKRELREEIGLSLKEDEVKYFMSYKKEVENDTVNKKHIEDIFIAQIDSRKIYEFKVQKEEVEQVKWLSVDKVKSLVENKKVKTREKMYKELFDYLNIK